MERIDVDGLALSQRHRFVARSVGTAFVARSPSADLTEIDLYDEISPWGVTAKDFRARLRDASGNIVLRINSPGGMVTDGIAIYNDLVSHKGNVRVEITGLAASIATIIAMAGDQIAIAQNAFFMIHNAWGLVVGNRHEMASVSEVLGKIDDSMARTYAAKSGGGIRAIKQMMDDETWMTGKEAKEAGFATEFLTPAASEAKAKFDLSAFEHTPAALRCGDEVFARVETDEDIEKLLMRDAGPRSRSQARSLIRDIRAGKTSTTEAMPGAGGVKLDGLVEATRLLKSAFTPTFQEK